MKFCPHCGNQCQDGDRFCMQCGAPQPEVVAPAPAVEAAPVEAPVPVVEAAPVEAPAPVAEAASVEAPAPAVEAAPVEAPVPVVEAAPVEAPAPAVEAAPVAAPVAVAEPVASATPVAQEPAVSAPKKKKSKLPLIITLIVVVLALAGGVVAGFLTDWFGLFPSEDEQPKEEASYSTLAAAAKATFKAKSITMKNALTWEQGEEKVEETVEIRVVFDRENNAVVSYAGKTPTAETLYSDDTVYQYAEDAALKEDASEGFDELLGLFTPDLEDVFGKKEIDWEAFARSATLELFCGSETAHSFFAEICDEYLNDDLDLEMEGDTYTYTSEDEVVEIVFTVVDKTIEKVSFKAKNEEGNLTFSAAFSNVNKTEITAEEIDAMADKVDEWLENNAVSQTMCEMCGEEEATRTYGGYNMCDGCYWEYDYCDNCGKVARLNEDDLCDDCAQGATTCAWCGTDEGVTGVYDYKTWNTYYFCEPCHDMLYQCSMCFHYTLNDGTLCEYCDGGYGVGRCSSCQDITKVRKVDEQSLCDDCAGDGLLCEVCGEQEALHLYYGKRVCDTCMAQYDYCDNCDEYDVVNEEGLCAACRDNSGSTVCEMCGEEEATSTYGGYNLCEECYWAYDYCNVCEELKRLDGADICADCLLTEAA